MTAVRGAQVTAYRIERWKPCRSLGWAFPGVRVNDAEENVGSEEKVRGRVAANVVECRSLGPAWLDCRGGVARKRNASRAECRPLPVRLLI